MTRAKVDLARKKILFLALHSLVISEKAIRGKEKKEREKGRQKTRLAFALLVLRFLIEIDGRDPIVLDRQFPRREQEKKSCIFCSHCSITWKERS